MLFIPYGSYTVVASAYSLRNEPCSNCPELNGLIAVKYVNVKHICYVPIFFNSNVEIQCKYCQEAFDLKGLDKERKKYFNSILPYKLPPIWLFSLPLVIIMCIGVYFFNSNSDKTEMTKRLVETPNNRILEYEIEPNSYSALRIVGETDENYYYLENKLTIKHEDFIGNLLEEKYFIKDTLALQKDVFLKWIDDGKIISVHY